MRLAFWSSPNPVPKSAAPANRITPPNGSPAMPIGTGDETRGEQEARVPAVAEASAPPAADGRRDADDEERARSGENSRAWHRQGQEGDDHPGGHRRGREEDEDTPQGSPPEAREEADAFLISSGRRGGADAWYHGEPQERGGATEQKDDLEAETSYQPEPERVAEDGR